MWTLLKYQLTQRLILVGLMMSVITSTASASTVEAWNPEEFFNLLRVLQPINPQAMDRSSQVLFDDFFKQKSHVENSTNKTTKHNSGLKGTSKHPLKQTPLKTPRSSY